MLKKKKVKEVVTETKRMKCGYRGHFSLFCTLGKSKNFYINVIKKKLTYFLSKLI
jgi:hypothetical protein